MNNFAARLYAPWIAADAAAAPGGRPTASGPAIVPGPRALLPRIGALGGIGFQRRPAERPARLGRLGSLEIRLATSAAEMRLGAYVGHGAVIDRKFGTTDVAIVLPVSAINTRYLQHFGPTAERHAA